MTVNKQPVIEKDTFTVVMKSKAYNVEPQELIEEFKEEMKRKIDSVGHPDINYYTAGLELAGFIKAFKSLGFIDKVAVSPDEFKESLNYCFRHERFSTYSRSVYMLAKSMEKNCPADDCLIFLNLFHMCQEIDDQIEHVTGFARRTLELELARRQSELKDMYVQNYAVNRYRKALHGKRKDTIPDANEIKQLMELLNDVDAYANSNKGERIKPELLETIRKGVPAKITIINR